jgi:CBS domain-containing protein/anti-sigma regulatory factor (Ser/Thr protein kinase)
VSAGPGIRKPGKVQELVHELMVRDVMTWDPITVTPGVHMADLRAILRGNRISGLPVVDDGRLVGVVSIEDFIESLADGHGDRPVEEKMTRDVQTLYSDDPLARAIGSFETSGLGRLPVIRKEERKLVGIVTKGDVIAGLLRKLEVDYQMEEIHRYRASHIFEDNESDSTSVHLEYFVKGGDFDRAGDASSKLKRTLHRLGLVPELVRRVAIASYEAEMNLAIFTKGGRIGVRVRPSQIMIRISDAGPGIEDVEKAMQPGYSTALEWVREIGFGAGMGLPNIQNMSDEFQIESSVGTGTTLTLMFATNGAVDETG